MLATHKITNEDIKAKMPKLSDAIMSMMHGLIDWESRPEHHIDMNSFGHVRRSYTDDRKYETCYGCAATAIVFEHWPDLPVPEEDRYSITRLNGNSDIRRFELLVNSARQGAFSALAQYYGVSYDRLPETIKDLMVNIHMRSRTWQDHLPNLCLIVKKLRELNL